MKDSLRSLWLFPIVYVLTVLLAVVDRHQFGVEAAVDGSFTCIAHNASGEAAYQLMRLFVMEGEWVWSAGSPPAGCGMYLQAAAFVAPLTTALVFLAVLSRAFGRLLNRMRKTIVSAGRSRTLIIGSSANAFALADSIRCLEDRERERYPRVLVPGPQIEVEPEDVLLVQAASLPAGLRAARAGRMKRIISFLDTEDQQVALVLELLKICPASGTRPQLLMQVPDAGKAARIFDLGRLAHAEQHMRLGYFDSHTLAARYLFRTCPLDIIADLQQQDRIHLVIHGGNLFALALAREAIYYFVTAAPGKLEITLIGPDAAAVRSQLLDEAPAIDATVQLEAVVVPREYLTDSGVVAASLPENATAHVVGLSEESDAVAYAVALRRLMLDHGSATIEPAPVYVHVKDEHGFGALLTHGSLPRDGIVGFGSRSDIMALEGIASPRIERLAKAIHDSYREPAGKASRKSAVAGNQRSLSGKEYEDLPAWAQESNRRVARHLYIKARAAGCRIVSCTDSVCLDRSQFHGRLGTTLLARLSEMEHRRWWAERALRGFVGAPFRSDTLRTHSEFIEFSRLSESRQLDEEQVLKICDHLQPLQEGLRPQLIIGVMGPGPAALNGEGAQESELGEVIQSVCQRIREGMGAPSGWVPVMLTNCAPGVDQIAMQAAEALAIERWAALPMPVELYAEQIESDAKARFLEQGLDGEAARVQAREARLAFERTAAAADICVSVPKGGRTLLQLRADAGLRYQQYQRAAELVVARCDLLIAVADGPEEAAGRLTREMIRTREQKTADWNPSAFFPPTGSSLLVIDPSAPRIPDNLEETLQALYRQGTAGHHTGS